MLTKVNMFLFCWSLFLLLEHSDAMDCSQVLLAEESPLFNYSGESCTWNVTTELGQGFVLKLVDVYVAPQFPQQCWNTHLNISSDGYGPRIVCLYEPFPSTLIIPVQTFQLKLYSRGNDAIFRINAEIWPVVEYYDCDFNNNEQCRTEAVNDFHLAYQTTFDYSCRGHHFSIPGSFTLLEDTSPITFDLPAGGYEIRIRVTAPWCNDRLLRINATCSSGNEATLVVQGTKTIGLSRWCEMSFMITVAVSEENSDFAVHRILILKHVETSSLATLTSSANEPTQMKPVTFYLPDKSSTTKTYEPTNEPSGMTISDSNQRDASFTSKSTNEPSLMTIPDSNQPDASFTSKSTNKSSRMTLSDSHQPAVTLISTPDTTEPTQMATILSYHAEGLILPFAISGVVTFVLVSVGFIVAVYLRKRNKGTAKNVPDSNRTDLENHTYQEEFSFDQKVEVEPSYNTVAETATSEPEYNYVSYPQTDNAIITGDGNMIYNEAYQSLDKIN